MTRKIVITSGKGGVGKTTVASNLGYYISGTGKRVLLVDVDFGLNNLDVVTGVEHKVVYDICDVFEGRCRIKQALIQCNERQNLYILPSRSVSDSNVMTGQNIKVIIDSISSLFDYIFFDCPAGIDYGFHRAVSCCDEALVVVTPNITSLRDADKVITVLKSYKLKNISVVVNRARGDLILNEQMIMPKDISNLLKTELIGVLPEEDSVFLSCGNKLPRNSESNKAYKILSNNLIKNCNRVYNVTNKYSGFFGSFRRYLKRNI